jgi:hypothetical protein
MPATPSAGPGDGPPPLPEPKQPPGVYGLIALVLPGVLNLFLARFEIASFVTIGGSILAGIVFAQVMLPRENSRGLRKVLSALALFVAGTVAAFILAIIGCALGGPRLVG